MPEIEKDIIISKLQGIYEFVHQIPDKILHGNLTTENLTIEKQPEIIIAETTSNNEKTTDKKIIKESVTGKESNNSGQKIKENIKSKRQNPKIGSKQETKTEILADQFQQTSFLNEALAQYNNRLDISTKLQSRPLQDISTAIGINEKFLFIKELFNDNAVLYQNTIDKLNNFANFNEAIQFIDEFFEWDFDNEQVQKLLELVHRRHTSA
jgi:hypothetical protein